MSLMDKTVVQVRVSADRAPPSVSGPLPGDWFIAGRPASPSTDIVDPGTPAAPSTDYIIAQPPS